MSEVLGVMLTGLGICLLAITHIHSRRIDRVHERISLTTRMNNLRDPWRDAEDRAALSSQQRSTTGE